MYIIITKDVNKAAEIIKEGRVVAVPTGTSYGLAADCLQGFALQRLRNLKQRPAEKSFTVFMDSSLWDAFLKLTDRERLLLERLAGRPLTLLVKPHEGLAHLAQDNRVGVRAIDHPLMGALATAAQVPLTATSANLSGQLPCQTPTCVRETFPGLLPDDRLNEAKPEGASGTTYDLSLGAILDGGRLSPSEPTTIAAITGRTVSIIRPGALREAEITAALQT
jgi:L-threonylcarbamoyladenylate synthase